jgi:hypothetical protein
LPDPDVQTPIDFQYYVTREGIRHDYNKRTNAELVNDVNVLHSFTKKLIKEKDRMQKALSHQRIWIRVLTGAVSGAWALVLVLLRVIIDLKK